MTQATTTHTNTPWRAHPAAVRDALRTRKRVGRRPHLANTKHLFAILVLCAANQSSAATTGIVSMNIGGETRLYSTQALSSNESIQLQYPDKTGATRCCIKRRGNTFKRIEADTVALDALTDKPIYRYRLKQQPKSIGAAPFLGMAVVGEEKNIDQTATKSLSVKLIDETLTVRSCTSLEGFHVIGEVGGKVVSDLYYGFDYEVENPTCNSN